MNDYFEKHIDILEKIKEHVRINFMPIDDKIEIKPGTYYPGYSVEFQLVITSFKTEKIKNIWLNFETRENNPEVLIFETIHGMKTYFKNKKYNGLIDDVEDYINSKQ
ncbi:MAG: hypothetical protein IIB95_03035 [Candidatus Marinimicrobia bacterium]|nr:hypothetical protein [Candidatus Neomarinimicrobiota bacterium]